MPFVDKCVQRVEPGIVRNSCMMMVPSNVYRKPKRETRETGQKEKMESQEDNEPIGSNPDEICQAQPMLHLELGARIEADPRVVACGPKRTESLAASAA